MRNPKLIIDEYTANVNTVCRKLLEGINAQENLNLKTKWDFFEYRSKVRKTEFDVNGIQYQFHGRGCFAFDGELLKEACEHALAKGEMFENMYILRFFLDRKEIYTIPYDDICYPENAIKIMTDDIIWNLRKNQ